jgi:hypothetical protein
MRRLASGVSRIVLGLAALAFLLGALLFLLGLQLALVPMRIRQHAQARLVLDIAASVAALVALRAEQASDEPEESDEPVPDAAAVV